MSAEIAAADSPHHVSTITMGTNKAVPGPFPDQTLQLLQEWQSHTIHSVKEGPKTMKGSQKFELNHLDILTSSTDDLKMELNEFLWIVDRPLDLITLKVYSAIIWHLQRL